MQSVFLVTAIIGFVDLVRFLNNHDFANAEIIGGAALIGALAGFFGIDHLTITTGIQYGLAASGVVTVAYKVAGK